MTTIQYKGFLATCEVDLDARLIVGEVLGIRDAITFEALTAHEVEQRFHEAIDDYLTLCAEQGREPEKSFSGRFLFRTTPERHRSMALAAAQAGISLNTWLDAAAAAAVVGLSPQQPLGMRLARSAVWAMPSSAINTSRAGDLAALGGRGHGHVLLVGEGTIVAPFIISTMASSMSLDAVVPPHDVKWRRPGHPIVTKALVN